VEDFFAKMGVSCLGLRRCFEFIVKEKLDTKGGLNEEDVFKKWLDLAASEDARGGETIEAASGRSAHEDAVFEKSYIPRTLGELYDPEREVAAFSFDDWQKPIYADTIELVQPAERDLADGDNTPVNDGEDLPTPLLEGGSHDSVSDASTEDEDIKPFEDKRPRGHRHEDRDLKKVYSSPAFIYTHGCLTTAPRSGRRLQKLNSVKGENRRCPRQKRRSVSRLRTNPCGGDICHDAAGICGGSSIRNTPVAGIFHDLYILVQCSLLRLERWGCPAFPATFELVCWYLQIYRILVGVHRDNISIADKRNRAAELRFRDDVANYESMGTFTSVSPAELPVRETRRWALGVRSLPSTKPSVGHAGHIMTESSTHNQTRGFEHFWHS